MKEFNLVQKIIHQESGEELDLAFLHSFLFVEEMTLAAPKLVLKFNDDLAYIQDKLRLKQGDKLELVLADVYTRDGMQELLLFNILSLSKSESILVINCLFSPVWELKKPAMKARAFIRRHPTYCLKKLFPTLQVKASRCFSVEDYHILVGERPTAMLNQLAQEQGGHIYVQRDHVCFSRLEDGMSQKADFTYHHNDSRQANQIIQHKKLSGEVLLRDKVKREYKGWNLTKGFVKASTSDKKVPSELYPSQHKGTLKKIGITPNPSIDFTCVGNGFLTAGMTLDLVWNLEDDERIFDESMPERVVAWLVAHYYSQEKYYCRVKGVTVL